MSYDNRLRQQVINEKRKRQFVITVLSILVFIYLGLNLLLGEAGLLRYRELYGKKTHLEKEINDLYKENIQIKTHLKALKENPFYSEKYAREEFGLAKPDEYIFQYDR